MLAIVMVETQRREPLVVTMVGEGFREEVNCGDCVGLYRRIMGQKPDRKWTVGGGPRIPG